MPCTVILIWLLALSLLCVVQPSAGVKCKIQRAATNHGFHRDVTTSLTLTDLPEIASGDACNVILLEEMPTGMYADQYQLKAGEDFGGPKTYSPADMNIEQPEYLSSTHALYIFGELAHDASTQEFHWSVTIPLHLRYHRPQLSGDTAAVQLKLPTVLLRCADGKNIKGAGKTRTAPCDPEPGQECQWRQIECQGEDIHFHVPVGSQKHQALAVWGTLTVTVGAMLYLCQIIIKQIWNEAEQVGKKYS